MSNLDAHQAIKLALKTYPDIIDSPISKANYEYASENEQAAFVIKKLLHKLENTNKTLKATQKAIFHKAINEKDVYEFQQKLEEIINNKRLFYEKTIELQSQLIDSQQKKITHLKEEIKLYKKYVDTINKINLLENKKVSETKTPEF